MSERQFGQAGGRPSFQGFPIYWHAEHARPAFPPPERDFEARPLAKPHTAATAAQHVYEQQEEEIQGCSSEFTSPQSYPTIPYPTHPLTHSPTHDLTSPPTYPTTLPPRPPPVTHLKIKLPYRATPPPINPPPQSERESEPFGAT